MLDPNWTLVPAVATPTRLEDAVSAAVEAWPVAVAEPRTAPGVACSLAHWALESGNFGMHAGKPADPPTMFCFNVGNTRPARGEHVTVCQYRCNEIGPDGRPVWYSPPADQSTFRAFDSLLAGMVAQYRFVGRPQSRYAPAWKRALAGDPAGFVRELKARGYFTGALPPYERAVVSIYARLLPIAVAALEYGGRGITDEDRAHVGELVALTLAESRRGAAPPEKQA